MDDGNLFGRSLSFPPRIGPDGRMAWSAGADNIRESIRVILITEGRERLMLPEFGGGLLSFLFEPNTAATRRLIQERISQSLGRWEPRISLESVNVDPHPSDERAAIATVEYKLVATGANDHLSLTIRLAGITG